MSINIWKLINKEWIFDIVKNMIYKDMLSKELYSNVTINNFYLTSWTDELWFKFGDINIDVLYSDNFSLFRKALQFINDLNMITDFSLLDKKYEFMNAHDAIHFGGQLFKNSFYNYFYKLYLHAKLNKRK